MRMRLTPNSYGDVVRFFMGPTMCNLSINNPQLLHELYRKGRERPLETYMFMWFLGKENLLFQHGDAAKRLRLRYGEMVTQRAQLDKVHEQTIISFSAETEKWNAMPGSMDLHAHLGPIIYDIMGSVLFAQPWISTEAGREVYRLHKKLIEGSNRWVLYPVGPIWHPGFIDYLLTIRNWRRLVGEMLDIRAQDMVNNPKKYENDNSAICMILNSKNEDGTPFFPRSKAVSTLCGFLNGAYDTTHATSYWLIYNLAMNPETQTKLLEEFGTKFGGRVPTVNDLRECEYLHAVLMESMRFRATVVVNQRVNLYEDMQIGDTIIPAGTNVNIPNCIYFKDTRWFGPETDKFRPERFMGNSPEAATARNAWIPFGEHTRMCIGQVFALAELKAMVYTVVTRCSIEIEDVNDPGEPLLEAGVCQPAKHCNFKFNKRDFQKMKEEDNLKWWMHQIEALENMQPTTGKVAQKA